MPTLMGLPDGNTWRDEQEDEPLAWTAEELEQATTSTVVAMLNNYATLVHDLRQEIAHLRGRVNDE